MRPIDSMIMVYVPAPTVPFSLSGSLTVPSVGYWIDKYQVSNAQYQLCVNSGICRQSALVHDVHFNRPNHPVTGVSWFDAMAYATWAGGELPTEAEWEYAAAGPTGQEYPWGDQFDGTRLNSCDVNCPYARGNVNWDDGYAYTAPVGSYPNGASWVGAVDLAGNVWEWTNSSERSGSARRVLRGGSWVSTLSLARTDYRSFGVPDSHGGYNGIRLVIHHP